MNFSWDIYTGRVKISTAIGIVAGAICLYGTMTSIPGMLTWPIPDTLPGSIKAMPQVLNRDPEDEIDFSMT